MPPPGEDGIYGLMLGNAAYLSAWKDDWVTVPIDEQEYLSYLKKKQEEEIQPSRVVQREQITGEYSRRWSVLW